MGQLLMGYPMKLSDRIFKNPKWWTSLDWNSNTFSTIFHSKNPEKLHADPWVYTRTTHRAKKMIRVNVRQVWSHTHTGIWRTSKNARLDFRGMFLSLKTPFFLYISSLGFWKCCEICTLKVVIWIWVILEIQLCE